MIERATDHPAVASFRSFGTVAVVPATNETDMLPTRYSQQHSFEGWQKSTGPAMMVER